MTRQETINKAVSWAIATAQDATHGYDQANRWGPNYDCSSYVISCWEAAGVPVKGAGASYTGTMLAAFVRCGFRNVLQEINLSTGAGLQKGDVLLWHDRETDNGHTELYIGDGKNAKASINEFGGVTGGRTGDQSGREIYIGGYYNYPWDAVLRYEGGSEEDPEPPEEAVEKQPVQYHEHTYKVETNLLKRGDYGPQVLNMQILLKAHGFYSGTLDGDFGDLTYEALRAFQAAARIDVDGEWGGQSFKAAWNYGGTV